MGLVDLNRQLLPIPTALLIPPEPREISISSYIIRTVQTRALYKGPRIKADRELCFRVIGNLVREDYSVL